MASVRFDSSWVKDWSTFHEYCKEIFGFFEGSGSNMDAWIDCMSSLDEEGMTKFLLDADEMLAIEITDTERFRERVPEIFNSMVDCTAFVNDQYIKSGRTPALALILVNE
jgi:RNAse (barnase) inhibitor barstar